MSEKLHPTPENKENLGLDEKSVENLAKIQEKAEKTRDKTDQELEELRRSIETKALSGKEFSATEHHKAAPTHSFAAHKQLKVDAYKRTLAGVRKKLPKTERTFSKLVHQDTVDKISNLAGKTLVRPSGVFVGGLFALFGSSFVLYLSNRYGFNYNFTVFVALLVTGYFFGLIVELMVSIIKKRRS